MTSLRARPFLLSLVAVLLLSLLFGPMPDVQAGDDDFEFGLHLAGMGKRDKAYFVLARKVFQRVIEDPNRSEADKDLCRYGIATMKRDEAVGATGNPEVAYADVLKLFDDGVTIMETFVEKNPDHARAAEAKLAVGTTRLAFVQWARDKLLADPDYAIERGAKPAEAKNDAERMVRGAIKYFDGLRAGYDRIDATDMAQLAQYYWVLCQYYLALVHEPGSEAAADAFAHSAKELDDFISLNDGQLLAVYAQDILGLTRWEQAKMATDETERENFYNRALEWFETCIETENHGPEWARVIANGYYHIGQMCYEAGRVGTSNFHRRGVMFLKDMEARNPTVAQKRDNGIRAMIEWSKLEYAFDRVPEAVAVAKRAGEYAAKVGKGYLKRLSDKQLREYIGGRKGGSAASRDPSVLMSVADDFYSEKKWIEAISAYQQVIGAIDLTPANVDKYAIRSWERIGSAYRKLGDLLACALSYEPIHEFWVDSLVVKTGADDDPNLIRMGNLRQRGSRAWNELYTLTGASAYRKREQAIESRFSKDYPNHPSAQRGDWKAARDLYTEAIKQKAAKDSRWRSSLQKADERYMVVAKDMKSQQQDAAWTRLIYTQYVRENWDGMLKAAKAAQAFWDSPAAKKQAQNEPTTAQRRRIEQAKALVWKSEAFYRKQRWDDVLKTMDGWDVDHGEALGDAGGYRSRALGHVVQAWIGKSDIPKANIDYHKLLEKYPAYTRLAKISFALAEHFNKQARTIDKGRSAARAKLNGTRADPTGGARTKLRTTDRNETRAVERLADVEQAIGKAEEAIDTLARLKKDKDPIPPGLPKQVAKYKKALPKLKKEGATLSEKVNRLGAEKEALEKEVTELVAEIKKLAQELYEPLTKAAGYYWDWDQALKVATLSREASNVSIFAELYYKAGLLQPDVPVNWERARSLFEDLHALSGSDEATKHEALGRLGTIYSRLAQTAEAGSDARAALVKKALERLQGSIAKIPENNDLVVGMLKGDVVVIPWRAPGGTLQRFPLPRLKTVEEFKRAVAALGTASGPKIPKFKTNAENKRFRNGLNLFKLHIAESLSEEKIKRTVKGFESAGFDMGFYRLHAQSSEKFRLAMAWIYTESGELDHMLKAYNLGSSLVQGNFTAEENSEDWWAAQVIRVRALINGAELRAKADPGKKDPTLSEWTQLASKMIRGLNTSSPDLGDDTRPETRGELKALLGRVELLRDRVGLKAMDLVLEKIPDEED